MRSPLNILKLFLLDLYLNKELIFHLTIQDFRSRYLGSYLGLLWAFIHPSMTILILWFVFDIGFKSAPVDNFPFILWLISGYIPWFFISEGLSNATGSVVERSYLVKKVVFRVSMLPIIKILSALIIHIFFILIIYVSFYICGNSLTIHSIQVLYFLFSVFILLLGLSWLTSSLYVFLKDVGQAISIILQLGFWYTPVFWSLKMIPEKYHFIIKLNPAFYIIEGYRNSFIYKKWFWEDTLSMIIYWIIVLTIFLVGALVFKKLRPHFADVL